MRKIFMNAMQNISPENFLPLPRIGQKTELISRSYDINGLVYSKSKSI